MNESATYYGEHEAEDAMAVLARWMGRNHRIRVVYHSGTAVDADIFQGIIRIPRMACASGITQEALMLLRGRVYHEAGHIDETQLSKSEYPKGALHEIWNALEDRRMEAVESSRHKGCEVVFRWSNHHYNRKIAEAITGGKDAPLWEALVAMSLMVEGIQPAWHLTPKAQDYLDASYQEFIKVKQCANAKGCLDLANVIYKLLKDVNEEWKKANPPPPPQQGQPQKGEKGEGEPQQGEGEGEGQGEPGEGQGEPGDEKGEPQQGGSKDFDDYENDKSDKSGKGSGEGDASAEGDEGEEKKDGTKGGAKGKEPKDGDKGKEKKDGDKKDGGDKADGDKSGKGDKGDEKGKGKGQGDEDADDDSIKANEKGSGKGKDGEKDDGASDGKGNAGDDQGKKQDASKGNGNESGKDGDAGKGSDGDGSEESDADGKGSKGDGADGDSDADGDADADGDGDEAGGDEAGGDKAGGDQDGSNKADSNDTKAGEEGQGEPNGDVKPGDVPYKPNDKEPKGGKGDGKDKRDLEDEFDGLSREQAQNEDLEEFFKNMPAEDKRYTSRRDLDVHSAPQTTDEDKTSYRERMGQVSATVAAMTRSLEQALRAMSKCRKNPYLRSGRIDRNRLVAIAKGLSKDVFFRTRDGMKLDVAVAITIDESGSMGNFYEVQLLAMAIGEALNSIGVPFEIIGTTTAYGGGDRRMVPMDGFSRVNPIVYKHYKLFGEQWVNVRHRIVHTGCYHHNVDGEVIEYAAFRLAQRPERRKVIFSLSDGEPCAGHFNDTEMGINLKRVCNRVRKQKIEVYGFGVETESPRSLYGKNWFVYLDDVEKMGPEFTREFVKIVTEGKVKV